MSKVIGFDKRWTEGSALRCPVVLARFDCGHVGKVELQPRQGCCAACGTVGGSAERCPCGTRDGRYIITQDAHDEANYITQVGDDVACATCAAEARDLATVRALAPSDVQHARYSNRMFPQYHLYRRDDSSPTGVRLLASVAATPAVDAALKALRVSPLSPTEGR